MSDNKKDICENIENFDMVIVPYEKEEKFDFKQAIDLAKEQKKENLSIGIVIGPEGGFDAKIRLSIGIRNGAAGLTVIIWSR